MRMSRYIYESRSRVQRACLYIFWTYKTIPKDIGVKSDLFMVCFMNVQELGSMFEICIDVSDSW